MLSSILRLDNELKHGKKRKKLLLAWNVHKTDIKAKIEPAYKSNPRLRFFEPNQQTKVQFLRAGLNINKSNLTAGSSAGYFFYHKNCLPVQLQRILDDTFSF